jgi:DHA3 family tetracycline resistance protein-like MFS transporter
METIFLVAGLAPVIFAAVAMRAARMRKDELANPLR